VLDQPTVSKRHCRFSQTPQGYFVEDLDSTNGTFVNGLRVKSPVAVCRTDTVRLGKTVIMPWPAETACADKRVICIGAASDNDIVLDLPMISRHHAMIRIEGDSATIEDLRSTNGTALGSLKNKIRRAKLLPGDIVYFGSHAVPAKQLLTGIGE
jgi:pSer/pThr/pTyr-binding forkhead associated (FHA) protein